MRAVELIFPRGLGGEQQALVVVGLEQIAQVPFVLSDGGRLVLRAGFRWLLQPEAEPVRRVGGDGQGPLPFRDLATELPELCRVAYDRRVDVVQRPEPGVVGGVELGCAGSSDSRAGAGQVVDLGRQEFPEDLIGPRWPAVRWPLSR